MKIILKSDVQNLGRAGSVVKVKTGYARNFLFPRKLALPVASVSIKEAKHKQTIAQLKSEKAQIARNEIAKKLDGFKFSFHKRVSPQGKLFGSITVHDIATALEEQKFTVDKKFIQLEAPIKLIGHYKVNIDFGGKTKAQIHLSVIDEKETKKPSILSKVIKKVTSAKQ